MPTKTNDALKWWNTISLEKKIYLNARYFPEVLTPVDKLLPYQIVEIWEEEVG